MKNSKNSNQHSDKSPIKKNHLIIYGIALVAFLIVAVWLFNMFKGEPNYAKAIAAPIERNLLSSGANKVCSREHDGRTSSNTQPWYEAYYQYAGSGEKAKEALLKAANDEGFNLTQANKENRGPLTGISDDFIEDWYFDIMSKRSNSAAASGAIYVTANVNADGANKACGGNIDVNDNSSVIGLKVLLPLRP